jgi:predicted DNA-binding transcriptional regulator YafY
MARNAELIRQWEILREIDGARTGVAVTKLAALRHVHQRTIRRDIEALCRAGFPLYDEKNNGTSMWKLRARPFRALEETGLGLTELCALYFSRSMVVALTGAPFMDDVERAIMKIERALPPMCRKYLDAVGGLVKAKATGRKKQNDKKLREITARLTDASLAHCRVQMRYRSASSRRTKEYVVEPLRLAYAEGGMYLTAYVPAYEEVRTFALERIETLGVLDEHFEPRPLPSQPFANSLGVNSGSPESIEIEFDADAADYVSEREWHRSQEITHRNDGGIVLRLCVCNDRPLRAWILGFGAAARVIAPASLAREIAGELERARGRYVVHAPRLETLKMVAGAATAWSSRMAR